MSVGAWKLRTHRTGQGGMAALLAGRADFLVRQQDHRSAGAGCPCVSERSRPRGATVTLQRSQAGCTLRAQHAQKDAAWKIERRMLKSAAAPLLESGAGRQYHAIVTGSSESGFW
jgi:hypothetical protein